MNLWDYFLQNKNNVIFKPAPYFPIYEQFFAPWRNKSLNFLEIGVFKGGSLEMWKHYFGPRATIVGVDINPNCQKYEQPPSSYVRIGDQADPVFWDAVLDEFGPFDIILDDASHLMEPTIKCFEKLYPTIPKNGLYMIEDTATSYWEDYGGGYHVPNTVINKAKDMVDVLHACKTRGAIPISPFSEETLGIHFYESMIVFEKGRVANKETYKTGQSTEN